MALQRKALQGKAEHSNGTRAASSHEGVVRVLGLNAEHRPEVYCRVLQRSAKQRRVPQGTGKKCGKGLRAFTGGFSS